MGTKDGYRPGVRGLFGKARTALLGVVLVEPGPFGLRELARRAGLAVGSAQREVAQLVEVGLLRRVTRGRDVVYELDPACPFTHELGQLVRRLLGPGRGVGVALRGIGGVRLAVFAPAADLSANNAVAVPDVADLAGGQGVLLVVGAPSYEAVLEAVEAASGMKGLPVPRLMVFSEAGLRRRLDAADPVVRRLLDAARTRPELVLIDDGLLRGPRG